ncbi:hypothetical protein BN7_4561 [Wickerhamomyces ciferrii]|uniref:Uncharacterized protein n=1 Tax=Wickerhamomyces ciferrii (strain ATCC 14091 / BCRC 22168 / CBS 111 / JCM 3599 / NBRC 0793 / NRRL Y-1031 F-60-10) TaxID=1206466 RepID=K0KUZ8_WICCF|nr:uncharacterized protein BN7_4561 [Wickerhamomyces ciferrii]CCH44983.1 hypothetical protein BN7_4561 [Wickerhamomyces ciferrii]
MVADRKVRALKRLLNDKSEACSMNFWTDIAPIFLQNNGNQYNFNENIASSDDVFIVLDELIYKLRADNIQLNNQTQLDQSINSLKLSMVNWVNLIMCLPSSYYNIINSHKFLKVVKDQLIIDETEFQDSSVVQAISKQFEEAKKKIIDNTVAVGQHNIITKSMKNIVITKMELINDDEIVKSCQKLQERVQEYSKVNKECSEIFLNFQAQHGALINDRSEYISWKKKEENILIPFIYELYKELKKKRELFNVTDAFLAREAGDKIFKVLNELISQYLSEVNIQDKFQSLLHFIMNTINTKDHQYHIEREHSLSSKGIYEKLKSDYFDILNKTKDPPANYELNKSNIACDFTVTNLENRNVFIVEIKRDLNLELKFNKLLENTNSSGDILKQTSDKDLIELLDILKQMSSYKIGTNAVVCLLSNYEFTIIFEIKGAENYNTGELISDHDDIDKGDTTADHNTIIFYGLHISYYSVRNQVDVTQNINLNWAILYCCERLNQETTSSRPPTNSSSELSLLVDEYQDDHDNTENNDLNDDRSDLNDDRSDPQDNLQDNLQSLIDGDKLKINQDANANLYAPDLDDQIFSYKRIEVDENDLFGNYKDNRFNKTTEILKNDHEARNKSNTVLKIPLDVLKRIGLTNEIDSKNIHDVVKSDYIMKISCIDTIDMKGSIKKQPYPSTLDLFKEQFAAFKNINNFNARQILNGSEDLLHVPKLYSSGFIKIRNKYGYIVIAGYFLILEYIPGQIFDPSSPKTDENSWIHRDFEELTKKLTRYGLGNKDLYTFGNIILNNVDQKLYIVDWDLPDHQIKYPDVDEKKDDDDDRDISTAGVSDNSTRAHLDSFDDAGSSITMATTAQDEQTQEKE